MMVGRSGGGSELRWTGLFSARIQLIHEHEQGKRFISSNIVVPGEFWWDTKRPDAPMLWDSKIELGEKLFQEIIRRPVPLDLNVLRALKRSTLGLDLYMWLAYRQTGHRAAGNPDRCRRSQGLEGWHRHRHPRGSAQQVPGLGRQVDSCFEE